MRNVTDWSWTDFGTPLGLRGRWYIFVRSGECLTTTFLAAYCAVFLLPGSTFARSAAFDWLAHLSHRREQPYAIMAIALSLTGPLAVGLDSGSLRIMSLVSQGAFFLLFGLSFWRNSPLGLGWITFVLSGLWLVWRAASLLRHHTRG